jgi:hypothetical protein
MRMASGPAFVERPTFDNILDSVTTAAGGQYQDKSTIYGDMSRLVVAWLARTPPTEIGRLYNELGWGGSANGRALHEAAKEWMRLYRDA